MARSLRQCPAGMTQHLIQRGVNRQPCFIDTQDYVAYASWLNEYARTFDVHIHAWVFMTNHVHLLVTPHTDKSISQMIQCLGRRYVSYFNHRYERSGTLWEGRFKSLGIEDDSYVLACQRYIELNPVRAGMVKSASDYFWSSYKVNALTKSSLLWTANRSYLSLGEDHESCARAYRNLF